METLNNIARQYQEACVSYKQLLELWELTSQDKQSEERERKLQEYQRGMEEVERKLVSLKELFQSCLLQVRQAKANRSG